MVEVLPGGHGAVSIGSPSQASAEGALAQWRYLNFLQLEEEGSHVDHCPHSAHAADKRLKSMSSCLLIVTILDQLTILMKCTKAKES